VGGEHAAGRILVAEDDRFYRKILGKRLTAAGHTVVLTENGEEAWAEIQAEPPELVISDWMMPRLCGYELCRRIKGEPSLRSVYCILLTAKDGVGDKIAALDVGADDYLVKPCDDEELLARVRSGLRIHRLCATLEQVSITDELTGLHNRRYLDQRLDEEVSRARRHQTPLSLVMIDLDGFKSVNDRLGHAVGDEVLARVGEFLRHRRGGEVAARIGGDEFVVVLPDTDLEGATGFARSVEESLAHIELRGDVRVAGSAGSAELRDDWEAADLLKAADDALYARKQERVAPIRTRTGPL